MDSKQVTIVDLDKYVNKTVTLNGWVYNKRTSGKIWFLLLRDGTGLTQCVIVKSEVEPEIFDLKNVITQESSVTITGIVRKDDRSVGGFEIGVETIEVHQIADEYPISPKEHGTDFLMNHRHLWMRSSKQHAILTIRHHVIKACREFFDRNGFILMDSPILTANAVEGTSNLFEV
ncbi:MAG: OB-fold nucleic acid binding domain-containing protein, partial [Candidatus Marinimicrobia bacterium]|nr:OB-fold nucleic acid binding domain-containing protein [Candidatus Neomarinimicrobiota bacterium]